MTDDSQIIAADDLDEMLQEEEQPAIARRPMKDTAELDITPMIDCVFLLLIFFLVSSKLTQSTPVELPPARHGGGVSEQTAVIITIAEREGDRPAAVHWGDGTGGELLPDDVKQQEAEIIERVQADFLSGTKESVLIKASRGVREKYVAQVGIAVGKADIEDAKLHIGVYEKR